jgi:hypothetical protein
VDRLGSQDPCRGGGSGKYEIHGERSDGKVETEGELVAMEIYQLNGAVQPNRFLSDFTMTACAWPLRLSSALFAPACHFPAIHARGSNGSDPGLSGDPEDVLLKSSPDGDTS